jgi:hypothetical protein
VYSVRGNKKMDNPENTEGAIKKWIIQRIPKGQSKNGQSREYRRGNKKMDNPENIGGAIKKWTIQRIPQGQ